MPQRRVGKPLFVAAWDDGGGGVEDEASHDVIWGGDGCCAHQTVPFAADASSPTTRRPLPNFVIGQSSLN